MFYERLFGPAQRLLVGNLQQGFLRTKSDQGLASATSGVNPIGVDHYWISIEGYEPDAVTERLMRNGISAQRLYQPDQVFFRDPDGILVQFAPSNYLQRVETSGSKK